MLNVGFIGVGGMGLYQTRSFASLKSVKVVAAADPSPDSRKNFQETFPSATVYQEGDALIADKQVQAIVIAVPTFLHQTWITKALKAGKPVMTEKPLGMNVTDCHQIIEASKKTKQLLMVAHCRRYDPFWGKMAAIVSGGKLGSPLLWRHVNASQGPGPRDMWYNDEKKGRGPMLDGAVHNYDFANLMFGKPVSAIASAIDLTGSTAVNTATAIIEYERGDQIMLSWSWGVAASLSNGFDILGTKGTLNQGAGSFDTPELDQQKYGYWTVTSQKTNKQTLFRYPKSDMYVNQAKHFVDCVTKKATCLTPATDAIKGVAVADAVFKSIKNDGRRTKVAW